MIASLRAFLPRFEPVLIAAAIWFVVFACTLYIKGTGDIYGWFYKQFFFSVLLPWLTLGLGKIALCYLLGVAIDWYESAGDPGLPLFLVGAGTWIRLSGDSWENAVLMPFIFVCALLNLCTVVWGVMVLFPIIRRRIRKE